MPTSDAGEIVGQELIVRIFCVLVILAGGAQISDVGLAHIGGLTELKWLNLRGTPVSSAGWEHLQTLKNLQFLTLGTVNDAGLGTLRDLKQRKMLDFYGSGVTPMGLQAMQDALPECSMNIEGPLRQP